MNTYIHTGGHTYRDRHGHTYIEAETQLHTHNRQTCRAAFDHGGLVKHKGAHSEPRT